MRSKANFCERMRKSMNGLPEKTLISLIDKAKNDHKSVTKEVRRNLKLIEEARREGIYWVQIAEALGFPGKFREVQAAWAKEKKMCKENLQFPGIRKTETENKKEPQPKTVKTENEKQKNEAIAAPTKTNGGRIGPPKPIGRGRLDLGCDAEDDEL